MGIPLLSFFTGGGFLDIGFEEAGFDIAWTNESNSEFADMYEYALRALRKAKGIPHVIAKVSNRKSIEDLTAGGVLKEAFGKKRPPIFGLIGGPPCPDFSAGGKNGGFEGKHGRLTKTFFDLICRIKPHFFLMENVPGLIRTKKHRGFLEEVIRQAEEQGYIIDYEVLNALELGVPQDRQRLFVIGVRRSFVNMSLKRNTPKGRRNWYRRWWPEAGYKDAKKLPWPSTNKFGKEISCPQDIPLHLTVYPLLSSNPEPKELPNGKDFFKPHSAKFWERAEGDVSTKSFKRLHRYRYSPTAWYGNNEVHLHPWKPRRLSARETLRIQTVPDEYVLPPENSLTAKFKMICNGVPCRMANCVAQSILSFLRSNVDILEPRHNFFVYWYNNYGREFPWRQEDVSPFHILVTEMLLRQTKASMVSGMWGDFTTKYPDPEAIVSSNENSLVDELRALGFGNQRSAALKLASRWLLDNHNGKVPDCEEELIKIPHVGLYTSRAVLCFAFGYKIPIVDLNILRFFSRYYGLSVKPDIRRDSTVWELAKKAVPHKIKSIKAHNYGLLDFTGEVCKPRNPNCNNCLLSFSCKFTQENS